MSNEKGKLLKIKDVPAKILELTGVTRNRLTIYVWIRQGRQSYDGRIIKLPAETRLRRLYVWEQDLIDFLREVG